MNSIDLHKRVTSDYRSYIQSFINIKDRRIKEFVAKEFDSEGLLPEPLVQFNPSYKKDESLDDLVKQGLVHPDLKTIFGTYNLYKHQVEAIKNGVSEKGFVVTSGTGSGKSLTYLATIFDHVLKNPNSTSGTCAILVYPMNALINSQEEEIMKYEHNYLQSRLPDHLKETYSKNHPNNQGKSTSLLLNEIRQVSSEKFPVRYAKYTGQEKEDQRLRVADEKPHIILTNYMMLELIMTRQKEEWLRGLMKTSLRFLVFDELHTYRGRQGADVSMLVRRIRNLATKDLVGIGTSATMATDGSIEDRKIAVAKVARTIFGDHYEASQIIEEYLETYTRLGRAITPSTVLEGTTETPDFERYATNHFCIWLEQNIALQEVEPGYFHRQKPLKISEIAFKLSEYCSIDAVTAREKVEHFLSNLEELNEVGAVSSPRKSFLPFRFHQFISQTSTVYVTLDVPDNRKLSLQSGRYIKESDGDRFIFPVLFSRYSGHEFICVRKNYEEHTLEPREPDDITVHITKDDLKGSREEGTKKKLLTQQDLYDGYILFDHEGDEPIWEEGFIRELPESWWKEVGEDAVLDNYYQYRVPQPIYLNPDGGFSDEPSDTYTIRAWYMPARLLFDPTSGVVYTLNTKENTKLMQLGNEGRSTATTITAFSVIRELMRQGESKETQKLLSFTDNRQDASLQAGHFNDFIATIRLRSAVYYALKESPKQVLKVHEIGQRVFETLKITEDTYAREPNPVFPDPENQRAVELFILTRILRDLKRGWRYNLPNLEQAGLLEVDYDRLEEYAKLDQQFASIEPFNEMSPEERSSHLRQILHFFRTSYALQHEILDDKRTDIETFMSLKLDDNKFWSPDKNERTEIPPFMVFQNPGKLQRGVYTESIGSLSYLGRYLGKLRSQYGYGKLKRDEYITYCELVCQMLKTGNFLTRKEITGDKGTVAGYRLRTDNILWRIGNENSAWVDRVRQTSYRPTDGTPNSFFQTLYKQDFNEFEKQIVGSEHTGQLKSDDRILREAAFRSGEISTLFCSPTMELGIDISELNIVHMRNVPPSPANYAQRSGRAGRSGQTAVVFTYCSNRSPHDRNYFQNPGQMVSGSVVPPKIDLINEELVASHLNAFILMKLGLSELSNSVKNIIQVEDKSKLPIRLEIESYIKDQLKNAEKWTTEFELVITFMKDELSNSGWYNRSWLLNRAMKFYDNFDRSFERWRVLFHNAETIIAKARVILDDPTLKSSSPKVNEAKRMHNAGMEQRLLLLNNSNSSFGNDSEFYIFRYLASEGFLPGYNFTRLPVRTFAGHKYKSEGEYISRSRFIALREFGPGNLIYHNGNKYRIYRSMLNDASNQIRAAKISKDTGYVFLDYDTENAATGNNDPITGNALNSTDKVQVIGNLLELTESEAIPQERISCEEEERTSTGYEIEQYFHYPKGMESTKQGEITVDGTPILRAIFCPSTELIQINHKWKRSKDDQGFIIHNESGKWLNKADLENEETQKSAREVKIFARDTADTLYLQPVKDLGLEPDQVISLAFALKRGIETVFQVEESEIGVWIMGNKEEPNIMIYESAEGSLGIVSQLILIASRFQEVYRAAYEAMHFNHETLEDTRPDLPKATYDDLLSYYNQPHHDKLDRHGIKSALEQLMKSKLDTIGKQGNRMDQYKYLFEKYDKNSATERPLIEYLLRNDYVLPDRAQVNLPDYYINVDFIFDTKQGPVLLFCDGSVHGNRDIQVADDKKRALLIDAGYDVITWYFDETLGLDISESIRELIEKRKDVFRKL